MPVPVTVVEAPPRETFMAVLRRYDREPWIKYLMSSYDCTVNSCAVEVDGVVAQTVFVPVGKIHALRRWTKFGRATVRDGWVDETAKYDAWIARRDAGPQGDQTDPEALRRGAPGAPPDVGTRPSPGPGPTPAPETVSKPTADVSTRTSRPRPKTSEK